MPNYDIHVPPKLKVFQHENPSLSPYNYTTYVPGARAGVGITKAPFVNFSRGIILQK